MSGRLIILPKKSYCPWKPENVQRVLRDEARHRQQESQQALQEGRKTRQLALSSSSSLRLKRQKQQREPPSAGEDESGNPGGGGGLRHVNLFESEEKAELERHHLPDHPITTTRAISSSSRSDGLRRCRYVEEDHQQPFYLRRDPYSSSNGVAVASSSSETRSALEHTQRAYKEREERRKSELDPMANFRDDEAVVESGIIVALERARTRKKRDRTFSSEEQGDVRIDLESWASHCTALVVRGVDNVGDNDDGSSSSTTVSSHDRARDVHRRRRKDARKESRRRRRDRDRHRKRKKDRKRNMDRQNEDEIAGGDQKDKRRRRREDSDDDSRPPTIAIPTRNVLFRLEE
jgi:hypothetical protein